VDFITDFFQVPQRLGVAHFGLGNLVAKEYLGIEFDNYNLRNCWNIKYNYSLPVFRGSLLSLFEIPELCLPEISFQSMV
jgi:hypothetical protein